MSFWHAVERKKYGVPVIINDPAVLWSTIENSYNKFSQEFLDKLPEFSWKFETSLQQNEMFAFNLEKVALEEYIKSKDFDLISDNLYRVQNIASLDYVFRDHLETDTGKKDEKSKGAGRFIRVTSLAKMTGMKIRVNNLGKIEIKDMEPLLI